MQEALDTHSDVERNSARALETLQQDLDGRGVPPLGSSFEAGLRVLMKQPRTGEKLEEPYEGPWGFRAPGRLWSSAKDEGPYKVLESRHQGYVLQRD